GWFAIGSLSRLRIRVLLRQPRGDGVHFRLRLLLTDARLETPNHTQKMGPPLLRNRLFTRSIARDCGPQFDGLVLNRKLKRAWHHANDGVVFAVERDWLVQHAGIGVEALLKQLVTQHRNATGLAGLIFVGKECAT